MSDLLRLDYINSLPQPFIVRFCGSDCRWPVQDIDVETGLMRIDVCGKLEVKHFGEVMEITDADGGEHDPDDWYADGATCEAPGCRNPTDRGICDDCDKWVTEQVALLEADQSDPSPDLERLSGGERL